MVISVTPLFVCYVDHFLNNFFHLSVSILLFFTMPHQIMFREHYGPNEREIVYVKPPGQRNILLLHSRFPKTVTSSFVDSLKNFFRVVFLPQGYPESVSKDYLSYQIWDTVQAFSSTLNGTLTTQAIMTGVGVGDQTATPLAAAITWILKDGTGNIGRIFFAWWKGTSLDADCKKWRLCADVLNDLAMFLELSLPLFMGYSTVLLCAATVLKSIVGVAGGATRAAITQHQAIRENMADVSAKDGSQETCVNLLASLVGMYLLTSIEQKKFVWILFVFFTFIHLFANFKAVKALTMSTLNLARLNIIIHKYLETRIVLHPDIVNRRESVFVGCGISARDICGYDIIIGESLASSIHSSAMTAEQTIVLQYLYEGRGYILLLSKKNKKVYVALEQGISTNSNTVVKAYFHAIILGLATKITTNSTTSKASDITPRNETSVLRKLMAVIDDTSPEDISQNKILGPFTPSWSYFHAIIASLRIDLDESEEFLNGLHSAGWATGGQHLGSDEWRLTWPYSIKDCPNLRD